jgi:branched-chain amino acid transport system substrate-binding protein
VAEREGAIYWENIAVADKITNRGYKNIFRCSHSGSMMGASGADFAVAVAEKLGIPKKEFKVAVISEDSDFGSSVGDGAASKVKENGLKLVADERYSKNLTDYSSMVLRLKAKSPDAIIATSYLNDGITIWRQMRELDLNIKAMIGVGTGYALHDFLEAHGKYTEGIFNSDATMSVNKNALSAVAQDLIKEFIPRFKAAYKHDPGPLAGITLGYVWALLTEVLPKAGSMDVDKIRAAAHSIDKPLGSYPTGVGLKFDEKGQNVRTLLPMMQWQNGKLPVVWPEKYATAKIIMLPLPKWSGR